MARKAPTEEQKRKAAARREAFRALAKRISDLTEDERLALAARAGIRTIEGRELSVYNQCLLLTQRGAVTVVGGFQQWKRAGRSVRKGETGLAIYVPTFGKKEGGEESATAADDGQGEGEGEGGKRGFIMGTVFDIAQTEAEGGMPEVTAANCRAATGC